MKQRNSKQHFNMQIFMPQLFLQGKQYLRNLPLFDGAPFFWTPRILPEMKGTYIN
jgi:hypothetical protein